MRKGENDPWREEVFSPVHGGQGGGPADEALGRQDGSPVGPVTVD